jgi:hypothetical protein
MTFSITNVSTATVTLNGFTLTGGYYADYTAEGGEPFCRGSLAAKATCSVVVIFSPSVAGAESTTFQLYDSTVAGRAVAAGRTKIWVRITSRGAGTTVGSASLYSGFLEGLLVLGMAAAEMEGAAAACTAAMRFLPRPGTSRSIGAWNVVLADTTGVTSLRYSAVSDLLKIYLKACIGTISATSPALSA